MPRPRKLTGYQMATSLAEAKQLIGRAKRRLTTFANPNHPPASEREWAQFLAVLLEVYGLLDQVQREIDTGLDITRENAVIDAVAPRAAVTELIERLQQMLDEDPP